MRDILDLQTYPIDQPGTPAYAALVARCQADLTAGGMFNLDAFLCPDVARTETARLMPRLDNDSFLHARTHNIYFKASVPGLAEDDPVLQACETSNNTLCADQLTDSVVTQIYQMTELQNFLGEVMQKPALYPMDDPLAAVNVMRYQDGQALNWHFDRSEFTVTLLLQAPRAGGVFEYCTDLRSADDPNYAGVLKLLQGENPSVQQMTVVPGTLNVFRGVNTPHRVTKVQGDRARMISVLTYYEQPGAVFTDTEQLGFYGRVAR